MSKIEQAILLRDHTALEQLIARFNTFEQARFYIEHTGEDFQAYVDEHECFHNSLKIVLKSLQPRLKFQILFREFLPNFIFAEKQIIITLGRDGLVANTAKYAQGRPIIGINPDKQRIDGKLCPFQPEELDKLLNSLPSGVLHCEEVSLAEARLSDGQRLLAFNDLFIGPKSHTSARYQLSFQEKMENQSSSGIIVSTGVGSSGWLSSVFNMTKSINQLCGIKPSFPPLTMPWNSPDLIFVVREPFLSRASETSLTSGRITSRHHLKIVSHMPTDGIIFSDGIENDFLHFNAGAQVLISLAKEKAYLLTG